jgi:DNA-3-methyladenine glycosylase
MSPPPRTLLRPVPRDFFDRPVVEVARALLGKHLVRRVAARNGGAATLIAARIVETEAYGGSLDPASHSFRGETPRCATMFGRVGVLYVYFTYGAHFCANVVAGSRREAAAVLLRAAEPVAGVESMRALRLARTKRGATASAIERGELDAMLARGPGNLAASFGFDRELNGADLVSGGEVWLADGPRVGTVVWTPRIGLGSNAAAPWHWRCHALASEAVTRVPRSWPRSAQPRPTLSELRRARR